MKHYQQNNHKRPNRRPLRIEELENREMLDAGLMSARADTPAPAFYTENDCTESETIIVALSASLALSLLSAQKAAESAETLAADPDDQKAADPASASNAVRVYNLVPDQWGNLYLQEYTLEGRIVQTNLNLVDGWYILGFDLLEAVPAETQTPVSPAHLRSISQTETSITLAWDAQKNLTGYTCKHDLLSS